MADKNEIEIEASAEIVEVGHGRIMLETVVDDLKVTLPADRSEVQWAGRRMHKQARIKILITCDPSDDEIPF